MPVTVICLRHGESRNVVLRQAGALPSAPLTQRGRAQARAAGRVLASAGIGAVFSSPAVRAVRTAEIIGGGLPVTVVDGLEEVHLGSAEGSSDPAVRARTAEVLRAWVVEGDLSARVADGETGHAVVARVGEAFGRMAGEHRDGTVALVGHVASLTAGLSVLCGLGGRVWGTPLPHAVPFAVVWDGAAWRCDRWPGDAEHPPAGY